MICETFFSQFHLKTIVEFKLESIVRKMRVCAISVSEGKKHFHNFSLKDHPTDDKNQRIKKKEEKLKLNGKRMENS